MLMRIPALEKVLSIQKEAARDYKQEYRDYHGKPAQIKERAQRNAAWSDLGLKRGDPREADHKNPISNGGSNSSRNIRAVSQATNRKKGAAVQKDGDWSEDKHPRAANGQFGSGSGSGSGGAGGGGTSSLSASEVSYLDYEAPETNQAAIDQAEELFDAATDEERDAVDGWSRGEYEPINNAIYGKGKFSEKVVARMEGLDSILDQSPLSHSAVLYRGIKSDDFEQMIATMSVGDKVKYSGYMSTTEDRGEAQSFSQSDDNKKDLMVRINANPGLKAMFLSSTWSRHAGEKEFLVGRGQTFRYDGIIETDELRIISLSYSK